MFHQILALSKHIVWKVPKFKAGFEPVFPSRHFSFVPSGETSYVCVYKHVCAGAHMIAHGFTLRTHGPN